MDFGWHRFKRTARARAHLFVPLADGRLISRCKRFVIRKPAREFPLIAPAGWSCCKDCLAADAKEGK